MEQDKRLYPVTPAQAQKFILNVGQQAAIDWLVPFCQRKLDIKKALLMGWAGTGKTFTINRVVEAIRLIDRSIKFGMTAPTHKAVRQLKKHSELKDELDFGTIHSFLGLKQTIKKDPKNSKRMIEVFTAEWNPDGRRKIDEIDVLIIDESSMLSDELYNHIDDVVRSGRVVVIFMGDGLQIPPVGKKAEVGVADAIPFVPEQRQSRGIHMLELSEIVRQGAGNPIIEYSVAIRNQYKYQGIKHEFSHTEDSGVEILPKDLKFIRPVLEKYFCTEKFAQDPDHIKVVCWRNDTANYFNREIRLLINKAESLPLIIPGDKLVLDKPLIKGKTITLPNNEEIDVLSCEIVEQTLNYFIIDRTASAFDKVTKDNEELFGSELGKKQHEHAFKVYMSKCKAMDNREYTVPILHEDSLESYEEIRKKIARAAEKASHYDQKEMWKQYFDLEKKFCWVTHNYCLTAHKAQGSTYDYCISMEWDIDQNWDIEERNRIRYVAATRARNKLFIVK
jgi:hypothetical protein